MIKKHHRKFDRLEEGATAGQYDALMPKHIKSNILKRFKYKKEDRYGLHTLQLQIAHINPFPLTLLSTLIYFPSKSFTKKQDAPKENKNTNSVSKEGE